jgi:hypothetical protein
MPMRVRLPLGNGEKDRDRVAIVVNVGDGANSVRVIGCGEVPGVSATDEYSKFCCYTSNRR